MIVDDDPVQRMLVREVLADDHSLSYVEIEDGIEALEQAHTERPDLIVLDVMLPSTDGFQICRRLKNDTAVRMIPIILLTARYQDDDGKRGREAGADALITKPFEPTELQAMVRSLLSQSSRRG
jgi:DNA-binding response OmpR family regulator